MPLDSESTSLFIDVEGRFDTRGAARILLNGRPLTSTASRVLRDYSDGFDWGYLGRGPAQTAIAICLALWPNKPLYALVLYPIFRRRFVAQWPHRIPFFDTIDITTFLLEEADCLQAVEKGGAGLEWLLKEGPLTDPSVSETGAGTQATGTQEGASATGLNRSVRTDKPDRKSATSGKVSVRAGLLPDTCGGDPLRFQPGDVVTIQGTNRHGQRAYVYGCYDRQPVPGGPIGQGVLLISESGVDLGGWGEHGEGHLVLAYHSALKYAYATPQQLRVDGQAGRFREAFTAPTPVAGSPAVRS